MSDQTIVRPEFLNMDDFGKMQQVANYFAEAKAFPKWVDNAGKLVMIMQAGRDLGLTVTQSMSGLAIINGIVTVYGSVAAVLMKRAGRDWEVMPTEKTKIKEKDAAGKEVEKTKDLIKTIKIWKWERVSGKETSVSYSYSEAVTAGVSNNDTWKKYTDDMLYRKCLARARKQVCPEVLDGVALYEDYKDMESSSGYSVDANLNTNPIVVDGEVIDASVPLDVRIDNTKSMDELTALLDEVRKSQDPKMVSKYAKQSKILQSTVIANDNTNDNNTTDGENSNEDATNIGEQTIDVWQMPETNTI